MFFFAIFFNQLFIEHFNRSLIKISLDHLTELLREYLIEFLQIFNRHFNRHFS